MSGFIGDLKYENPQSITTNGLGANSNVQLTSSILLVTPAANNDSIDGFIPAQSPDGLELEVLNVSNTNTMLLSANTNSLSGYRIVMPPGFSTLTLRPGGSAWLVFSQGIGWRPRKQGLFEQDPAAYIAQATVDFNAANTDTQIALTLPQGFTRYVITAVFISGASASISTATCGLFTAAAGGGTAIVSAGSAITVTTASDNTNNNTQSLTVNNAGTESYNITPLFFRVATAQGSAATGKVSIHFRPVP